MGITAIIRLFDFEVPKSEISVFLCFSKNGIIINAPIITPLPARRKVVNIKIQVGNFSNSDLNSKTLNLKILDIAVAMIKNINILFHRR